MQPRLIKASMASLVAATKCCWTQSVDFVDEFPMSLQGKILETELREKYGGVGRRWVRLNNGRRKIGVT